MVSHAEQVDLAGVQQALDLRPLGSVLPECLRRARGATGEHGLLGVIDDACVGRVEGQPVGNWLEEAVTDEQRVEARGRRHLADPHRRLRCLSRADDSAGGGQRRGRGTCHRAQPGPHGDGKPRRDRHDHCKGDMADTPGSSANRSLPWSFHQHVSGYASGRHDRTHLRHPPGRAIHRDTIYSATLGPMSVEPRRVLHHSVMMRVRSYLVESSGIRLRVIAGIVLCGALGGAIGAAYLVVLDAVQQLIGPSRWAPRPTWRCSSSWESPWRAWCGCWASPPTWSCWWTTSTFRTAATGRRRGCGRSCRSRSSASVLVARSGPRHRW